MLIESTIIEAHLFKENGDDLEFLLLKRSDSDELYPGTWQMVSGSIMENEKAFNTALREINEETGLLPSRFWAVPNVNSFYNKSKDSINMIPVFAGLINKESNVVLSSEHSEFGWFVKEEAKKKLLWLGQRNSVDIIYDYYKKENQTFELVEIKVDKL